MRTYRTLYHGMVRSMSEAIDLYDEGKGILAREVLKKRHCWTQKSKSSRKISFPTNPSTVPTQRRTKRVALSAASKAMPPPQAVCRHSLVTRASR